MDGDVRLEMDEPRDDIGQEEFGWDSTSWLRVFRHAYSLVKNTAEAEDLTQEAFAELFRAESAGRPVRQIGAWMRTVTKRLAYRHHHKLRPDLHTPLEVAIENGKHISWEPQDTQPSPEKRVIDRTMVHLATKTLSELSDRERECVLMYFRGYDFPQIASVLGVSRWTARRLTLDVIKRVRTKLHPEPKR